MYLTIAIHLMERSGFVMNNIDKYIRKLNEIDNLVVFVDGNNQFCVRLDDYDIKEAGIIRSAVGRGSTLLFALQDYVKEISGRTLVNAKSDKEVRVLIIEMGEK